MHIALYSPSIPRDRGRACGAAMAMSALADALTIADHRVSRPSLLATIDDGDAEGSEQHIRHRTRQEVECIARRLGADSRRPDVWVTYGMRGNAPDLVGPALADALRIPYVLIDPRGPHTRTDGPAQLQAIDRADAVIPLSDDSARWVSARRPDAPQTRLSPFIDPGPYDAARRMHGPQSATIGMRLQSSGQMPRLLCVSAMRPGDRLAGYQILARALSRLVMIDWQLIVIGDGPARRDVDVLMRGLPLGRTHLIGEITPEEVIPYYAVSDLLVAPAVGGTHGRTLLEAQATGLPVVAGDAPGVRDVVRDGMTGRLCPPGNAESLAQAVSFLLRQRNFLSSYAAATTQAIAKDHHIAAAAAQLDEILRALPSA